MSTTKSAATHPFVAHLRQVAALEQDRWVAADEACAKAQHQIDEARRRLTEAEGDLAQAEQQRLIASERVSAVAEMITSAMGFLNEPAAEPSDAQDPSSHQDSHSADPNRGGHTRPPESRTLKELVLAAFTGTEVLSPSEVAPLVRVHRPKTTDKAVRATLTTLRRDGALMLVERGFYRLPRQEKRM
ncbi:hypothetical protein ABWJ92_22485 [Streptomyces sp. NPDC000609]|uniref:hypothetical protein n=1 Tax=Streptomyces sp. NPDC000609 TaxID=3160957 RepID=UPI0033915A53